MTNKQAQYEPKFSRLLERYDEACHGNAEQMRDILEVALDALETAERHIFNLEAREVILPKPSMVKYVSGEFVHCWPAYTVDTAIRSAGIKIRIKE